MVERVARELPIAIRYAHEGQQGLNYARNTGIRQSSGTYFSYVDDDIEVSPDWLASLHESFVTTTRMPSAAASTSTPPFSCRPGSGTTR